MRAVVPLVALSVALSVACSRNEGSKAGAPAAARRSLTIGISQEPDTLWLPFKEMSASEEVARPTGYTLTQFDENWQLVPWAAERIPTVEGGDLELFEEGGVQKMRTRWRIRPEFNWADGKPLIADDFITAFRIYNDPELEVVDRSVAEKVEKMEPRARIGARSSSHGGRSSPATLTTGNTRRCRPISSDRCSRSGRRGRPSS
jgi:ABC-type transport system substrate-binding protein